MADSSGDKLEAVLTIGAGIVFFVGALWGVIDELDSCSPEKKEEKKDETHESQPASSAPHPSAATPPQHGGRPP